MTRRVRTDVGCYYDDDDFDYDKAYAQMQEQPDEDVEDEDPHPPREQGLDYNNYKGIYFNDDPSTKYQDPQTGAHFNYEDILQRKAESKKHQAVMTEPSKEEVIVPQEGLKDTFASGLHFKNKFQEPASSKLTKSTHSIKPSHGLPLANGGGTGGSGGTRNFLSTGNTRQDNLKQALDKKQKRFQEQPRRGGSTYSSQGPDYVKAILNKYYKAGRASTGILGRVLPEQKNSMSATKKDSLHQRRAYQEMLERQGDENSRTLERKKTAGTEARVHTQANDNQQMYFKTDSKEMLALYQEKKKNLARYSQSHLSGHRSMQDSKKFQRGSLRKSGEQPLVLGQTTKSRNLENVRVGGSYGSASQHKHIHPNIVQPRPSNVKSYATLEQFNPKSSATLKPAVLASKPSLQAPMKKATSQKNYLQGNYNYRGKQKLKKVAPPGGGASQLHSALFHSYMKSGGRAETKASTQKLKTSSLQKEIPMKPHPRKKQVEPMKPVKLSTDKFSRLGH